MFIISINVSFMLVAIPSLCSQYTWEATANQPCIASMRKRRTTPSVFSNPFLNPIALHLRVYNYVFNVHNFVFTKFDFFIFRFGTEIGKNNHDSLNPVLNCKPCDAPHESTTMERVVAYNSAIQARNILPADYRHPLGLFEQVIRSLLCLVFFFIPFCYSLYVLNHVAFSY